MYWCKSKPFFVILTAVIFFISVLTSCKQEAKETHETLTYFDLKGFFDRDSARLAQLNKPVLKTVQHNGETETKTVHIANWGLELSLFKQSDINRPAWKNSYKVQADSNFIIYIAKDPELRTKKILIRKVNGKIKWILIFNQNKNILYRTAEKLSYFPDSLYLIEKSQSVRFLGTNKYRIKGLFNQ
jgi:hypothetical protein